MRRVLTDGGPGSEYWDEFEKFQHSAWRWEQQPIYWIGYEREQFDRFLAGDPEPPTENEDLGDWMRQVERHVSAGRTVGRVRVVDDPPTDYQRWMLWMDRWNREAGEDIRYLSRRDAERAGIIPAIGPDDWWLFDDRRLVVTYHDDEGRRIRAEAFEDEPEVEAAIQWRGRSLVVAESAGLGKTANFLHAVGHLKLTPRSGWQLAGVEPAESVAEHSFRAGVIAFVLAKMEGAVAERAATLALFHDLPEIYTTDLHSVAKRWVTARPDSDVARELIAGLPPQVGDSIEAAAHEFGVNETPEARCAKDADKLECLLQAREYEARGNPLVKPWVDTMLTAVVTDSGRRLAEAAMKTSPDIWWHDIVASYGK